MDEKETDLDFEKTVDDVQRRQRYFKKTPNASQLVARVLTKYSVASSQANRQLDEAWKEVVGQTMAQQTRPLTIRRGVLEVIVTNSAVHQQLIFKKRNLVDQLCQQESLNKIKDIRFRVGEIESTG